MIKALFFDIDGTLVSFKTHQIPVSTVSAIAEAKARGVQIFISTGRPKIIINNLAGNSSFLTRMHLAYDMFIHPELLPKEK